MPEAIIRGIRIHYQILGKTGPWVAVMSGGRQPLSDVLSLNAALAEQGLRVLLFDRANCGKSGLLFDGTRSEEVIWRGNLGGLLDHLGIRDVFVIGHSRTVQVAIMLALKRPGIVRGIGLWGPTGGATSQRFLVNHYYDQYIQAAMSGGMEKVCVQSLANKPGHFSTLIQQHPANEAQLKGMDPAQFIAVMQQWRARFVANLVEPVMGLKEDDLRAVRVPVAILPRYDNLHPVNVAQYATAMIPGAQLFDFSPDRKIPKTSEMDGLIVATILGAFDAELRGEIPPYRRGQTLNPFWKWKSKGMRRLKRS